MKKYFNLLWLAPNLFYKNICNSFHKAALIINRQIIAVIDMYDWHS